MTKAELMELLKDVGDNQEIYVVSSDYVVDDDSTWIPENNSEFDKVVDDCGDCYLVMDAKSFE